MPISIARPGQLEEAAAAGTGTGPRVICARGLVGHGRDEFKEIVVSAFVYDGHVDGGDDPPNGAPSYSPDGDTWYFAALAVADCANASPFPPFTLKVWAVAAGTTLSRARHHIWGKCASQVDCGSGPTEMKGGGAPAAVRLLAMAPLQWALSVAEFLGEGYGAFNGPWLLSLREGPGDCVWDNGGDGAAVPLVELRCEGPLLATWRLRFRRGERVVEYSRPAADWGPLGANVFTTLTANGSDPGLVPSAVTVVPV